MDGLQRDAELSVDCGGHLLRGVLGGGWPPPRVVGLSAPLPPTPPPHASKRRPAVDQWSRPAAELIFGVRPKSVIQTTRVVPSSPRPARSATSAGNPLSSGGRSFFNPLKLS